MTTGTRQEKPVVIVVDDDDSFRNLLKDHFNLLGYEVRGVQSVQSAKELADSDHRDMVAFIDVRLPDGSGLDVVSYFFAVAPHRIISYIITGEWSLSIELAAGEAGSYGIYEKLIGDRGDMKLLDRISNLPNPEKNPVIKLMQAAAIDERTGLDNFRQFRRVVGEKLVALKNKRYKNVMMIVMDIDGLKDINDTYGHQTGTRLLSSVGGMLKGSFRNTDNLCRYGGDEFGACIFDTEETPEHVKVRLKESATTVRIRSDSGEPLVAEMSVGVCFMNREEVESLGDDPLEVLWKLADQAMYKDKENSRSRSAVKTRGRRPRLNQG